MHILNWHYTFGYKMYETMVFGFIYAFNWICLDVPDTKLSYDYG